MSSLQADIHAQLVERLKANDRAAQKQIYDLYAKSMFNISFRILNDAREAEDVLQEAFLDMFLKIDSFRKESTFGAWFKRIVTNKSLNQLKKRKYFMSDLESISDIAEEYEEEEMLSFSINEIKQAVASLADGFRTIFVLYMFEDYSHYEIAKELNISTGTSKSQLSRAKLKVRQSLMNNNLRK